MYSVSCFINGELLLKLNFLLLNFHTNQFSFTSENNINPHYFEQDLSNNLHLKQNNYNISKIGIH